MEGQGREACSLEVCSRSGPCWDSQQGLPENSTTELRINELQGREVKRREEMKAKGAAALSRSLGALRADGLHHTQQGSQLTSQGLLPASISVPWPSLHNPTTCSLKAAVTIWGLPAGPLGYSMAQNWAHTGPERRLHTCEIFSLSKHWRRKMATHSSILA